MSASIHLPTVMRSLTIKVVVTGRRPAAVRVWLGCRLMAIAAFVIGCPIEVTADPDR